MRLLVLQQLKDLGVRIAMDDFGTGYSSLSYLRRFPFDKIKIDQSFIRDSSSSADSLAIVKAVIGLGHSLGLTTTAEGVETEAQLRMIREQGCTEVQGFLFSPPLPGSGRRRTAFQVRQRRHRQRNAVQRRSLALLASRLPSDSLAERRRAADQDSCLARRIRERLARLVGRPSSRDGVAAGLQCETIFRALHRPGAGQKFGRLVRILYETDAAATYGLQGHGDIEIPDTQNATHMTVNPNDLPATVAWSSLQAVPARKTQWKAGTRTALTLHADEVAPWDAL